METNNKTYKKSNRFFILLSILLGLTSAYLAYELYYSKKIVDAKSSVIEKTAVDYFNVKQDALDLSEKFNDIQSDNVVLNKQLDSTRIRIQEINKQLERNKNDKTIIAKLKAELGSIRDLIKSYLFQIDTLNTANQKLTLQNQKIEQDLTNAKSQTDRLSKDKEILNKKVELGSKIKAVNFACDGVKEKGSEYSITNRARRTDKIRSKFTIIENAIAKKGERTLYLVILGPDNTIFNNGSAQTFKFKGEDIIFSAKKSFDFANNPLELEMFYTKNSEFDAGRYNVKLICEEAVIGEYNLDLK